jgi:hypothetical protein
VARDLTDDVGGGAEPVQAEALGVPRHPQRPVADQTRAQQRRCLEVRVVPGERQAEALVGERQIGIAAVALIPGEDGAVAQVLPPRSAVAARPVGPPEPRDSDAIADGEPARSVAELRYLGDDLMPGDQGKLGIGELAVDHVEVGAAHAAGVDAGEQLALSRARIVELRFAQRLAGLVQHHRVHRQPAFKTQFGRAGP